MFTIDNDNNVWAGAVPGNPENVEQFSTLAELKALAENWGMGRLVEIWNSFAGHSPVKRFMSRKQGVVRIWKAAQTLTVAAEAPAVATKAGKTPSSSAKAPKAPKSKKAAAAAAGAGGETKRDQAIAMIQAPDGATLPALMTAMGWQAHSVRGFIATLGSKHGMKIESFKNEAGERVYRAK